MAEPARNPRGRGLIHISGFTERGFATVGVREQNFRLRVGAVKTVDLYLPDDGLDSEKLGQAFSTILASANREEDPRQLCAFIAAAINIIMPMTNEFTTFFTDINCRCNNILIPSGIDESEIEDPFDWWETMTLFMQLVLLLYKNVGDANYLTYMNNRVIAARAFLSAPEQIETKICLSLENAKIVRRILGGSHRLRSTILLKLLSARAQDGAFGQMCTYICGILSWTEMSYITFIYEEIVLTDSPILSSTAVASEIKNFTQAMTSILTSAYPQYYKILTPPALQRNTDRNKFPTLIAVAVGLKRDKSNSVKFYVPGIAANDPAVAALIAEHMKSVGGPANMIANSVAWLRGGVGITGGMDGLNQIWEA